MNARTSVYRVLALDGQVARAREATFRIASVLCCSPAAAAVCIGDSARTRSPPIETSNKTASSITSLILSCRIIGTVWLENWLPHVLCIGCVPRRELMKTTNFSSGTNRDAIAGLLPSARVRCQRFARWQCKSSGTRNLAYFVTAGEAVTLLLPSRQGCSGLVITCPTNSTRALVTSAPG